MKLNSHAACGRVVLLAILFYAVILVGRVLENARSGPTAAHLVTTPRLLILICSEWKIWPHWNIGEQSLQLLFLCGKKIWSLGAGWVMGEWRVLPYFWSYEREFSSQSGWQHVRAHRTIQHDKRCRCLQYLLEAWHYSLLDALHKYLNYDKHVADILIGLLLLARLQFQWLQSKSKVHVSIRSVNILLVLALIIRPSKWVWLWL